MLKHSVAHVLIAAIAFLATQAANALVITTYSDRASWEAAVGDFIVENFDSTPDNLSGNTLTLDFGGFSVTLDHGHSNSGIVSGRLLADLHASNSDPPFPRFVAFDFFQPITAFAMDLFGVGSDGCGVCSGTSGGVTVATFAGSDVSVGFNLLAGTSFFGLVSQGVTFDSLLLTKLLLPQDNRDHFQIDDVAYRVDEPSTLALFGVALGVLGFAAGGAAGASKRRTPPKRGP